MSDNNGKLPSRKTKACRTPTKEVRGCGRKIVVAATSQIIGNVGRVTRSVLLG